LNALQQVELQIRATLENYFEAMHSQDMEKFDSVFHPNVTLYSAQGNELVLRPYNIYHEQVVNRQSPKELGNPRADQILMIDVISESMALAKVQLQMFGGIMQDYLNFVKIDGHWWIIAKLYEKVGEY
jgi:hypothetical protein